MPTSAASSNNNHHPSRSMAEDLIERLTSSSSSSSSSSSLDTKLKALRELKNLIIGNRTKKLSFLKLNAVPAVVSVLSSATGGNLQQLDSIIIESAAVIGSFACGLDAGVQAVLDAGAFPLLLKLISYPNHKVVDAGARSLKLIYQSKLAPKFDFLQGKNMEFLLSLLNSENENVAGLGASIITHSCQTRMEQKALSDAGVIKRLSTLLQGSLSQRNASLESLAAVIKENQEVASKFVSPENGSAFSVVVNLTKDKYPPTRLLACICLIVIRNTIPSYLQDVGIKIKLVHILLELVDDPGQVGDEAPFALSRLISEKEDVQKLAFEADAIDKLCDRLERYSLHPRRLEGILLALADLCSKLECCRSRFLKLKALNFITNALSHDSAEVRAAASICLKNVTRSVKCLSAGAFTTETLIFPLVHLLDDISSSIQVAALGAISNIVVDFMPNKKIFMQCGAVKKLVQLSKSMDTTIRSNATRALRNLMFHVDNMCKEGILMELTQSTLTSLICDPEASVQEQALALVRNLVDGPVDSIDYVFAEDGALLQAIGRQLQSASKAEVLIQGMHVFSNVASGNELHKEAVMQQLFPQACHNKQSPFFKFLQSNDSRLRTAAAWALVNLTFPSSPGACSRIVKLRNAGVVSILKNMLSDPCLDVKLRARTALGQSMAYTDSSP